MPGTSVLPGT